jgi:hypothetical protein
MTSWNPKHDQATIDRAVSMVTGGEGRTKRTLREVADELGVSHVTVHKWVYRTARQATTGSRGPSLASGHECARRPEPILTTAPTGADPTGLLTELIDHHRSECERLTRENAALKATVVLLVRDLDDRI